MDETSACLTFLIGVMAIDLAVRRAIAQGPDRSTFKAAGLLSMLALALGRRTIAVEDRGALLKRYLLSVIAASSLIIAGYSLLTVRLPSDDLFLLGLALAPIAIMPLYHFLYGLIGIKALAAGKLIADFRLRGAISLLLSSNIILGAMSLDGDLAKIGHLLLAYFAMVGSLYLCSSQRIIPSIHAMPRQETDAVETSTLLYLTSLAEIFYGLVLIHLVLIAYLWPIAWPMPIVLTATLFLLLILMTLGARLKIRFNALLSLELYEERAIPLTFMWFGLMSVMKYYF